MQAFRDRKFHLAGVAGFGVTAAFLLAERVDAIPFVSKTTDIRHEIANLQSTLPADQEDGSVLEEVTFDGRVLTLQFSGDDRLGLQTWRESGQEGRCERWAKPLRKRQVAAVEYRYLAPGAVSSVFVDRTVCG